MRHWKAPPGWNSILHDGRLKPFGPHQRTRCSGWLHTLKTSARGASSTRVMTRTRSSGLAPGGFAPGAAAGLGIAAIVVSLAVLGRLHLQLVQVVLQAVEALRSDERRVGKGCGS